jgi:SAM-dependent methyltransferase
VAADRFLGDNAEEIGSIVDGIARFPVRRSDTAIEFYRAVGGARFHERASVPFSMSALDTEVYHSYLAELRPRDTEAIVIDIGGGDGRNALPWLQWGARHVVIVDVVHAALARFRARIAADHPEWLGRLLLIEADARNLPLRDGCAARVQTIEALAYLNEDYVLGLRECVRLMANDARLIVADRDYEAGLLTRLFYGGGVRGMLEQSDRRDILDGNAERTVRSRCFTADEFAAIVRDNGLRILSQRGISALSLILGHERSGERLAPADDAYIGDVHRLLAKLGRLGHMLRSHVVVAERAP